VCWRGEVKERERESVCMFVCERESKGVRERERKRVSKQKRIGKVKENFLFFLSTVDRVLTCFEHLLPKREKIIAKTIILTFLAKKLSHVHFCCFPVEIKP
jgi:hypothetical protein